MTTPHPSKKLELNGEKPSLYASPAKSWTLLLLLFLAVHFVAMFTPPLLDDADGTHADAAQHMALSGDWVTLYVNGIRYLEKPPLPYWLVAIDYHLFGYNVFCDASSHGAGRAGVRHPGVGVGAARLRRTGGVLRGAGGADLAWASFCGRASSSPSRC